MLVTDIEEALFQAARFLAEQGDKPDIVYMHQETYWFLKYQHGLARYKPRIKGQPRTTRRLNTLGD